jgi:hypothetical protein
MENKNEKQYIGNGVYLSDDGYHIILETDNGHETKNIIYLDYSVYMLLRKIADKFFESEE